MTTSLYIPTSKNKKTGNIIQQFIGKTRNDSKASCKGCPLLNRQSEKPAKDKGQVTCYAQWGTEAWGHSQIIKAWARGKDYSLSNALKRRSKESRFVRFSTLGDSSALNKKTLLKDEKTIRKEGLGVLNYTHFWKSKGKHLKGRAMASCDSWQDAKKAATLGWRTFLHVPHLDRLQGKTEEGLSFTKCPAQRTDNKITCDKCGLCDATKKAVDIIVIEDH